MKLSFPAEAYACRAAPATSAGLFEVNQRALLDGYRAVQEILVVLLSVN